MTLGIGMYAPCMVLVGLLGMNAKAAFPIMMGSCAFLMPIASARFVQKQAYSLRPALGLAIGGIPAVLIAALHRRLDGRQDGPLAGRGRGHHCGDNDAEIGGEGGVGLSTSNQGRLVTPSGGFQAYIPRSLVTVATELMATM